MDATIRLVVGLGNPGREHDATRHNAGFWFVEALAAKLGCALLPEGRFHGRVARAGSDVRLLAPGTYMNLSGRAVAALSRYFSIAPDEVLVAHDELDLPAGEARLKFGGGTAGHNGLRDVDSQLGTTEFWRLRLGIGHPRDSAIPQQDVADYVLRPPPSAERLLIVAAIERSLGAWPAIAAGDMNRAMQLLHTKDAKDTKQ